MNANLVSEHRRVRNLRHAVRREPHLIIMGRHHPSVETIIRLCTEKFDLEGGVLAGKSRIPHIVKARHACMYLSRKFTSLSLRQIGNGIGGRSHHAIYFGAIRTEERLAYGDRVIVAAIAELTDKIKSQYPKAGSC